MARRPVRHAGPSRTGTRAPWSAFAPSRWRVRWRLVAMVVVPAVIAAILADHIDRDASDWSATAGSESGAAGQLTTLGIRRKTLTGWSRTSFGRVPDVAHAVIIL